MYSQQSWHTSSSYGASATFRFTGNYSSSFLFTFSDFILQGLEYGFLAQEGRTTGLTVSPSMARLYLEMRNLKNCHSSKYSVVDLAFRTARILPCSPTQAQVLLLILTRLCSRQRPVLLRAFLYSLVCVINQTWTLAISAAMTQTTMDDTSPAITYLPTQKDWVFDKMQGWYNNTLQ